MATHAKANGPDFAQGVPVDQVADGATLAGRVGDEPVLVSRRGEEYFAIGGVCTHYGAHLADGLFKNDTVRCPWHHACFSLRSGEALAAPAFDSLPRWSTEVRANTIFVTRKLNSEAPRRAGGGEGQRMLIVGGGAAGFAAAEMLRRRGFAGDVTILSADSAPPCDRPNLSKDYLAGAAPEEWVTLKGDDFYRDHNINLRLGVEVARLEPDAHAVVTATGERVGYDKLLLATGATPVRLTGPGFDGADVHVLRTFTDARAIIDAASRARSVAIVGASFIGLEAAASMRARGLTVHVVAPDTIPMQRVLGSEIGAFIRGVHEANGVLFHLGRRAERYAERVLHLDDGAAVNADFVILGVGVRPNTRLAAEAGLTVTSGVVVDAHLRTSSTDIFAAGDIAEYMDRRTGHVLRIEHWVHAQRQGQIAAVNMLGEEESFAATPYFWSNHYEHAIRYVGAGVGWDDVSVEAALDRAAFTARYSKASALLAVAALNRDRVALETHAAMDAAAAAMLQ